MATEQWPSADNFSEVPDELVDQIWATVFSKTASQHPADVNAHSLELESQAEKDAQKAHHEAKMAKARFTEILMFWDAEHDKSKDITNQSRNKESVVVKVRANISQMHCWEDAFASIKDAEYHYQNSSKFRRFFRRGTSKSEQVEPFVDLIPDTHFTSVICAGIKFILGACSAAKRSQQDIMEVVETLPERIDGATQYAELYRSESILQVATCQLYVKVLTTMESIIEFWTKDRSFEFLKPLFLQSSYMPLRAELDDLRKASENVERTIQLCNQKRLAQVADGVKGSLAMMHEIKKELKQFFAFQYMNTKWFREIWLQKQPLIVQSLDPRPCITTKEILKYLGGNTPSLLTSSEEGPSHLLQQVLQAGFSMAEEDQHRATWAMSDPKVYEWFKSRRSRALVINGNCAVQRISPLSFFCALLIQSLQSLKSIIVIHHFCGLQTTDNSFENEEPGASAIIKTLVYQLAMQWKVGTFECLSSDDVQAFKSFGSIMTEDFLFSILSKMVKALPRRQPIFIIIDGFNYYETQNLCHKMKKFVKRLVKLLGSPASVKLLITSTTRILDVSTYFENDEKLLVPADPPPRTLAAADQQLKRRFTFSRSSKKH